jgi:hypothetical protein
MSTDQHFVWIDRLQFMVLVFVLNTVVLFFGLL